VGSFFSICPKKETGAPRQKLGGKAEAMPTRNPEQFYFHLVPVYTFLAEQSLGSRL
jgi:hypothetical protein